MWKKFDFLKLTYNYSYLLSEGRSNNGSMELLGIIQNVENHFAESRKLKEKINWSLCRKLGWAGSIKKPINIEFIWPSMFWSVQRLSLTKWLNGSFDIVSFDVLTLSLEVFILSPPYRKKIPRINGGQLKNVCLSVCVSLWFCGTI